jgi:catechol 2,3-dioxygenase
MSVGGYHHHLAVNTWGRRTRPAARDGATIALLHYEIRLPDPGTLTRLAAGLDQDAPQGGMLEVDDPTGIRVRFTTQR